ncbi:DNA ligase D [Dechloromonas sp. XY25]|uniref:DNA ligase (ATP) n=1 Tax=Dechloromonas hankyongensis TaxID=2908002 RepID=A0ABS9K697_9RHOO|nr:DNA ligase D [Dechloromonas hankyongensis]MCG2578604.1 DNA ligase D [Dechloromonas hankyongensis]
MATARGKVRDKTGTAPAEDSFRLQTETGHKASRSKTEPALAEYRRKRDFTATREPAAGRARGQAMAPLYVVQKHAARRLHYDFRLELGGTLKSWAVPKGPSLDPAVRRLAVHVEDHPLAYADFEGSIPAGHYGAGEVIVWDRGVWEAADADPAAAYRAGKLKFHLLGEKLSGGWTLVRSRLPGSGGKEQWLLIKENDAAARQAADYDIVAARPDSVLGHAPLPEPDAKPDKAVAAALPARLAPTLATLVATPPAGDWRYEVKFDGYRLLARVEDGEARLFTRNGLDWTAKLPEIAAALRALDLAPSWLDGEIIVPDAAGRPDFQALQNAFERGRSADIVYCLFDLPYHAGLDLRAVPLEQRRARLESLLAGKDDRLRFSTELPAGGGDLLRSACALGLEGIIGKRAGSSYVSRRSADWIKLKCKLRQEFVIGGYSAPQGGRSGFGALLLGVHEASGALRYAGRVGTGFSEDQLHALHARMQRLAQPTPPFSPPPGRQESAGATWLAPELLCEVEFAAWTREGLVRQAVFRGLRADKPAQEIVRERPAANPGPAGKPGQGKVAGIAISHGERVIDAESGTTKRALAEFYDSIAPHLLAQLAGRPLSLLRAPEGIAGEQFFQRHAETLAIPGLHRIATVTDDEPLIGIDSRRALIGAVQMGTVEFHSWNTDFRHIERPDRIVLDLDPDPALPWARMVEATHLVLVLLDELGLAAYLKTSGGKGMHIVVPLAARQEWEPVKAFAKGIAQHLARHLPRQFVASMGPKNRVGKIFVDYLRNQQGASTVAAYSVRARPGLPVSVPISRDELETIDGAAAWNVHTLAARLAGLATDPWVGYAHRQRLTDAMRQSLGLA